MKKLLMTAAILGSFAAAANAQQGSWYIGGNGSFMSSSDKSETLNITSNDGKVTSWQFAPEVGTFLTDNLSLGLGLNLNGYKYDYQSSPVHTENINAYGGTLYSRYFFGAGAFRPFLGLNLSLMAGKGTNSIAGMTDVITNYDYMGANLNAGFAYALSPRVTAVGSFGTFGIDKTTQEQQSGGSTKYSTTNIGLDAGTLGNRFTIGVYYTFSK